MRANPPTPLETFSEAEWDWVFDTGLKGTLIAMQEVFPHMKARGCGAIINFGSMRGTIANPSIAAYTSAKQAIRQPSRTATTERGQYGIIVNITNTTISSHSHNIDDWSTTHLQPFTNLNHLNIQPYLR